MECINHIFNAIQLASKVRSSFASTTGFQPDHSSLQQLLQQWWTAKAKNAAHKLLLQATPILICWNLWKNRCACKYGGIATNTIRVNMQSTKTTYKMLNTVFPHVNLPAKWTNLVQQSERCVHNTKVSMVKWIKPPDQWIKVNTDCNAITNPSQIGAVGILRDKEGRLEMAFTTPLGEGSNNKVQIEGALSLV
ncbi:hypothetical protein EJD97_005804 [Solanum chilense]|uniref:RNase H type-1 domain-containing protein n=1 Tax=Solanum chilense TaxID=4083 RepID=A0A6N2AJN8_SOLCI|nr:hypothetical protein EJD97_005804 [Solanum chilense]